MTRFAPWRYYGREGTAWPQYLLSLAWPVAVAWLVAGWDVARWFLAADAAIVAGHLVLTFLRLRRGTLLP